MRIASEVNLAWTTKLASKSVSLSIENEFNVNQQKNVKRKTSNINRYPSSHQALSPVLILAQLFAVMPIFGITTKHASGLKFNWINYRMLYCVSVMLGVLMFVSLSILWAASSNLSMKRIEPIIWFLSKLVIIIYFINLARKWSSLMINWENIEKNVPPYDDEKKNWRFCKEIKLYTATVSILIFVEHSMSIATGVYRGGLCTNTTNVQAYFHQAFPQIYMVTKYSAGWKEFFAEFLNYYCVFLWSFMDIFVVAISKCLGARLNQFNEYLLKFKGMAMPKLFWSHQRKIYTDLCNLIRTVDKALSILTTMCISNNLYYILIQLLNTFQPKRNYVESIYFWFSLTFLLWRALLVVLCASRIHDESKIPIQILRNIPQEYYHKEAKRFLEQVINDEVSLTGMRFFHLTRTLLLSITGTIVTYELVLIQFQMTIIEPGIVC